MSQVDYLLYILSQATSHTHPKFAGLIWEWYERVSVEKNKILNPQDFCRSVDLNYEQTKKFHNLFIKESPTELSHRWKLAKVQTINICEENYPKLLKQIPDPPLIIYYRGNLKLLENENLVGFVGSRRATKYGIAVTEKLVSGLSNYPFGIISGLAYGIDAVSHKSAIANNIPTVAVLGSGPDDEWIYPRENFKLAMDILDHNGLIISEYPPGSEARKHQFIARNRIIAGLSCGVVIEERGKKSGALITSDFAMDFNRSVFAVPGPITSPLSFGPHQLIEHGAKLIQSSEDILEELGIAIASVSEHKSNVQLSPTESLVLKYMQIDNIDFEEISNKTRLPVNEIQATLSSLELKGLISQVSPQIYQKV